MLKFTLTGYFKDYNLSKVQMLAPWWWLLNRNM